MSNQVNASELLQKLLDERYEAGREAGYAQGLGDVLDFIKARMTPGGEVERVTGSFLADHPGDENDADPPGIADCQPAYIQKALEYVRSHPGVTAHEAGVAIKSRNALYTLHRLGLVEKRGTQFFPKNAEARA